MEFVADESVDRQIVDRLRREAHRVFAIAEMAPGSSDETVLDLANRERAILLTADKDFGELVFRQRRLSSGVILIRLAGLAPADKAALVGTSVQQHGTELQDAFTVLSPRTVRIRRPKA